MDEIFAQAKNILIVWVDDTNPPALPTFQELIQTKSKKAEFASENVKILLESRRPTSSSDIILFDLVSKKDTSINVDLLNEFFRLLHPNGYLFTHIPHAEQTQSLNHFKICGFINCNPLDSNYPLLIENKDNAVKKHGSLWLCQKPSFDIGYSVPLRRTGVRLIRQISKTGGGRKAWTVEDDDDDEDSLHDANDLLDVNHRKKPDVKNCDCGTKTSGDREAYDASRCASCAAHGSPPFKSGEHATFPKMSDV